MFLGKCFVSAVGPTLHLYNITSLCGCVCARVCVGVRACVRVGVCVCGCGTRQTPLLMGVQSPWC